MRQFLPPRNFIFGGDDTILKIYSGGQYWCKALNVVRVLVKELAVNLGHSWSDHSTNNIFNNMDKTEFYFLANTAFLIFLLPLCTKDQFELKKKSELYLLCFQKDVFFSITKAKMRGIGRGVFKKLVITSRESNVCWFIWVRKFYRDCNNSGVLPVWSAGVELQNFRRNFLKFILPIASQIG